MDESPVTVELLGGLRAVTADGRRVDLPRNQAGALFAVLALRLGEPIPREQVLCALWPDDDVEAARHRLRQTLYLLRRELTQTLPGIDAALQTTRDAIFLDSAVLHTDVRAFDTALREADAHTGPARKAASLANALALYRGDLLPDFYNECFAEPQRRLAERRRDAARRLPRLWEAAGEATRAIGAANAAVALDPLDEETHCLLMRLYAATGQPSQVARQYRDLETILARHSDQPSPQTRALMESLRETGRAVMHAAPPHPAPVSPTHPAAPHPAPPRRTPHRRPRPVVLTTLGAGVVLTAMGVYGTHRTPAPAPAPVDPALPQKIPLDLPAPRVLWTYVIPLGDGDTSAEPTGITVGPGDAVAVTGFVDTRRGNTDYLTVRFDANGHKQWDRRFDGTGHDLDRARAVTFDYDGNVTVVGESDNGGGAGDRRHKGLDIVAVQYAPNGDRRFVLRWDGDGHSEDRPVGIGVGGKNNLWVAGSSWSAQARGGAGGSRMVCLKIAHDGGTRPLAAWTLPESVAIDSEATDLEVDGAENVVVTGFGHTGVAHGPDEATIAARLDGGGSAQWIRSVGGAGTGFQSQRQIAIDRWGNALVAAPAYQPAGAGGVSTYDTTVTRVALSGATLWSQTVATKSAGDEWPRAVGTSRGDVAVTGEWVLPGGERHLFVASYDADGRPRWHRRFQGEPSQRDTPEQMRLFRNGDVAVVGASGMALGRRQYRQVLTALRLSADGTPIWLLRTAPDPTGNAWGKAMAPCSDGGLVIAGQAEIRGRRSIVVLRIAPDPPPNR